MHKKISGILIMMVLVLSLCMTSSLNVMAGTQTWYVDDSNTSGTEDGTQAHPYNTIGEAVTAASAGDTVIVAGGTYVEDVSVQKSLKIKAQNGETPTINRQYGVGFHVTADRVIIDGFTIMQAGTGIYLEGASSCKITGNTLADGDSGYAIRLKDANTNVILGNTCTNNTVSSTMSLYNSHGNIITNNTCTGVGQEDMNGLRLEDSFGNEVAGNSFSLFYIGLINSDSTDNLIVANVFSGNSLRGIYISGSGDFSCILIYNTIDANINVGISIIGVSLDATDVFFKWNNITGNGVGVSNDAINQLDATANYWNGNTLDVRTGSDVDASSPLAAPVTYTMPVVSVVTTSITTSTTTETETSTALLTTTSIATTTETQTSTALLTTTSLATTTETETATSILTTTSLATTTEIIIGTEVVTQTEISTSTTTDTDTVTLVNPTTLTETQSVTSTDTRTETSTITQQLTSTDTQSLTYTVTVSQTVNHTETTTLTVAEEGVDVPVIVTIAAAGLLAGGLLVTIIIRKV